SSTWCTTAWRWRFRPRARSSISWWRRATTAMPARSVAPWRRRAMRSRRIDLVLAAAAAALAMAACSQSGPAKAAPDGGAAGQAFLKKNATDPAVKTLGDGLQYRIVKSGPADGQRPRMGDDVKVNYEGTLIDGTGFDSTFQQGEPAAFTVGPVIPAG